MHVFIAISALIYGLKVNRKKRHMKERMETLDPRVYDLKAEN